LDRDRLDELLTSCAAVAGSMTDGGTPVALSGAAAPAVAGSGASAATVSAALDGLAAERSEWVRDCVTNLSVLTGGVGQAGARLDQTDQAAAAFLRPGVGGVGCLTRTVWSTRMM
jgi:hypothetical protein